MSTTTTQPTTVRHRIGTCPGCKCSIYAEVQIVTEVHDPRIDSDGKPQECAHAVIVSASVDHACDRDRNGEWM